MRGQRLAAQLANDEKQRQRFKKEHEARKKKAADKKPEETKAEPEPSVPEQTEESEPGPMPQAQTFSSRQSEPTAQMTGEEKVWVAEGSLGLVRAVRATYFFARITAFFTGDAVGCQKTVMLFSRREAIA